MSYKKLSLCVRFFLSIIFLSASLSAPAQAEAAKAKRCALALTSVPSSSTVISEGQVSYTYVLKNSGRATCSNTSFSVFYSGSEKYASSSIAPTASDYYWYFGSLAAAQSKTLTLNIKNVPTENRMMYGEACASADGSADACVSKPVTVASSTSTASNSGTSTATLNISTGTTTATSAPASATTTTTAGTNNPVPAAGLGIQAWIYPGAPACNAANELSDGRRIDTLKAEYYTLQSNGTLRQKTAATDGCNGFSAANLSSLKSHSSYQFVTVSGGLSGMRALTSSLELSNAAVKTLTDFVVSNGLTGVELDWEQYSDWTSTDYSNYKRFAASLQTSLRSSGKKLMLDAPAIANSAYQSYFLFKYEDFTNIDYIAIMAYDYQYDFGVGTPVAPDPWVRDTVNWAKARLPLEKIVVGIPSYGYHGAPGSYKITIDTYAQSSGYPGFADRQTNIEGEESWTYGGIYYAAQSSKSLDRKKALLESIGITNISVWHLGGNQWFSSN